MNYSELDRRARRRLPRVVYDFVAGGADDEVTVDRNRRAFDDIAFVPRVLRGVVDVDTSVEVLGQTVQVPVIVAPASVEFFAGRGAYTGAIRGAHRAGTITGLAGVVDDEVAIRDRARGIPPQWAQCYTPRVHADAVGGVEKARRLGSSAVILTVSTSVPGNRERDVRNRLTVPIRPRDPRSTLDLLRHPRWLRGFVANRAYRTEGLVGATQGIRASTRQPRADSPIRPGQTWEDLAWLRDTWGGPVILKGVMSPDDAVRAVETGCAGIVVSNHGGRQLDGTPATIEMLAEIVDAVGGRAEVYLDGGVRRGTDVVKALCLGARAVLVGRPWVFAATLDGETGVADMLGRLRSEIATTMHLLGVSTTAELDRSLVRHRASATWERVNDDVNRRRK